MHLHRAFIRNVTGVVFLLLLAGISSAVFGQSATGTLTGTLTDPKGLAMANAMVVVHNEDTGVDHQPVTTNGSGVYEVPLLPPGNYDVTASQTGFATVQHKGVTLQVGQTLRIDIEMPVASQQQLVTVTTEVPLLETEKTEISSNVSENLVSNLPVGSRRWEEFALLTPGVSPDGTGGGMSFHGINGLYNNNSVDGANNNDNYNGGSRGSGSSDGYIYSADSIREFQVASSGFDSEVGQSAGGSVNAVTKSGTNQWHGDLFYNGRTPGLNAVDPVAKTFAAQQGTVATQSVHQQNQWGGSLGGKIITDKLFFFFTDDGYRKVFPKQETTSTPNIAGLSCPTGGTNPVTPIECAAAKNYILTHFVGQFGQNLRQDIELVKLDYQLNSANHISGVANIRDWKQPVSPLDQITPTMYLQDRFAIANWTMVIGSNKVNELRYQYGLDNNFSSLTGSMPGVTISNIVTYGDAGGGSSYGVETRHQVSDNFSWTKGTHAIKFGIDTNFIVDNERSANNSGGNYQYTGAAPLPGSISCTGGAVTSVAFCSWLIDLYGTNAGDTITLPNSTVVSATGEHYNSFNQFIDNVNPGPPASFRFLIPNDDFAGFVQDTWKVRPTITINAGLRYDVQLINVGQPLPNSIAALLPLNKLPAGSSDLPILDQFTNNYPPEYDGVQPRLGAAWNIRKNTVVRVSGGIFFAKTDGHNVKNAYSGASETTTACSPGASSCVSNLIFPDIFFNQQDGPIGSLPVPGAVPAVALNSTPQGVGTPFPQPTVGIRGVDPGLKRPRVYSVDAAVEEQLPGNMNLSISYSFARGVDLPRGNDFNVSPVNTDPNFCSTPASAGPQSCGLFVTQTYDVLNAKGSQTTAFGTPFYSSRGALTGAPAFSDRVDPRTGVINGNSSSAESVYNGAIVSLRKPMTRGVELVANYTISLATDNGMQGSVNGGTEGQVGNAAIDRFNLLPEQGHSSTDTTHRFTSSVVYVPTFGKNVNSRIGKELLDGWSVAGTVIAQTGAHYTALINSNKPPAITYMGYAPGSSTRVAFKYSPLDGNLGGDGITSPGSADPGRVGWLAPGGFILPNLYNVDLRVEKAFAIKERYHISIRGEAFNLLNSTLVQGVNNAAFDYAAPTASTLAAPTPACWSGVISSGGGPAVGTVAHTNTCMVPLATFQTPTTTTGGLLGARQLQAGVRFEF